MNSLPGSFFQRELGWGRSVPDFTRHMSSLSWKPKDRVSLLDQMNQSSDQFPSEFHLPRVNPIYSMEYCPDLRTPNILAATDEVGCVALIDTRERARNKVLAYHRCHKNSLSKVTWNPNRANVLATASSDQLVNVWNLNGGGFQQLASFSGHGKTVKTVKFHPSQPDILASAGRDGSIMIWDLRVSCRVTPVNLIQNAHSFLLKIPKHPRKLTEVSLSVTDIIVKDDYTLISCGATDGLIKFWDTRKSYTYLKRVEPVKAFKFPLGDRNYVGYSAMCLDSMNNLYASTPTRDIFKFNLCSDAEVPEHTYARPLNADYSVNVDVSRDGRYLVSGSGSNYAYIWDTLAEPQKPILELEGNGDGDIALCCTAFCPNDPFTIVVGGDDGGITMWRVDTMVPSKDKTPNTATNNAATTTKSLNIPLLPKYLKAKLPPFNLTLLLDNLPNYVMDGISPHVPDRIHKCETVQLDLTSWLGGSGSGEKRTRTVNTSTTPSKRLKVSVKSPVQMTPTNSRKASASPRVSSVSKGNSVSRAGKARKKRLSMSCTSPGGDLEVPQQSSPSIRRYFTPILNASPTVQMVRLQSL